MLGLPYATQAGIFWFDTLDRFMNHLGLVFACLVECIVFGYIYGAERIRKELKEHRGDHLGRWWNYMIRYFSPVVLILMLGYELRQRYLGSYENYGRSTEFLFGWLPVGWSPTGSSSLYS